MTSVKILAGIGILLSCAIDLAAQTVLESEEGIRSGFEAAYESLQQNQAPEVPEGAKTILFEEREPPPAPTVSVVVHFELDSARIRDGERTKLDQIVNFLRSHPDVRLEIQGHTDALTGTPTHNAELSERRATEVERYLREHGDIPASRLEPRGLGQMSPLFEETSAERAARNRRVDFVLHPLR